MDDNGIRTHRKKSMSFSKSSLVAHKAISAIYLMVSKIYLYRFMRLNIFQINVYQSLFINKANVNRGSRNGRTCINGIEVHQIRGRKLAIFNPDLPFMCLTTDSPLRSKSDYTLSLFATVVIA